MQRFLWNNFFKSKKKSYLDLLKNQPLFSKLSRREIRIVSRIIHERSYFPGEFIFKPHLNVGYYIITQGSVQIFYGNSIENSGQPIATLKEGDCFGELALIQEKGYPKTWVQSVQNTEVLCLFKSELTSLVEKYPRLGFKVFFHLAEVLGTRLQKASEKLSQIPLEGEV